MAAVVLFAATALWLQVARTDLDWVHATLSLYLHGPHGGWLRAVYCLLAAAIVLLAVALHVQAQGPARRGLPLALFCTGALGLAAVAIGDSWLPGRAPVLAIAVHALAAQTAFLCATVAMLVQAWCFSRDGRWHGFHRFAWAGAWLAFAGLWVHVLWRATPRGLGQKAVIALVLAWLAAVAWRLLRMPPRRH
ncbi:DUF998 domain-containing protein [Stenotrophomonas sp. CPCC 101365]|uniref:DUF998 domain-containing protein n=1 Tax=Stenotrophomonas mori TaxID=2871096 RepID=A0ABT0SDA8_9GAMM|nr:DUF998 domain-containing protein [Stenotrophomonas mori]MCL7713291.1 DUF998 domain-containing protein [Stenotrophomonas mori]